MEKGVSSAQGTTPPLVSANRSATSHLGSTVPVSRPAAALPGLPAPTAPAPRQWGRADLDPSNNFVVGPPDSIPDCEAKLTAAGIQFRPARLPVRNNRRGQFVCGTEQAVVYLQGPEGIRFWPSPRVSCGVALALARLEQLAQEEAERHLGSRIRSITQIGTYNCRKMAAYNWVSEHSYANAIDLERFVLQSGQRISVLRHFDRTDEPSQTPESRFLRTLARRLYDEGGG